MIKVFCTYFIFVIIGIIPNVLAGYNVLDWQWWAVILTLNGGVCLHTYSHTLD
jgi:hypothetical protein